MSAAATDMVVMAIAAIAGIDAERERERERERFGPLFLAALRSKGCRCQAALRPVIGSKKEAARRATIANDTRRAQPNKGGLVLWFGHESKL
jgi:hypothetical protein